MVVPLAQTAHRHQGLSCGSHVAQARLVLVVSKVCAGDVMLEELESRAQAARKGLWAAPHPVPPWEWRKRK